MSVSRLHAHQLGDFFAVVVAVAPHQLHPLLAAEVQLNLVLLREADAAVYLLTVRDHPGIIARVAGVLDELEINIDSVLQEPHLPKERLSFVITVETVPEGTIGKAADVPVGSGKIFSSDCPFASTRLVGMILPGNGCRE